MLVRLAVGLENIASAEEFSQQMLLLAESFAQSWDFERAAKYYQMIMSTRYDGNASGHDVVGGGSSLAIARRARLGLADIYRRNGLVFEAEQVLREGLLVDVSPEDIFPRLFELALTASPPDLEGAAVWLGQYGRQSQVHPGGLVIMQARLLAASSGHLQAERLLRGLLAEMAAAGNQVAKADAQVSRQAGLRLAEILLAAGEPPAAERQCLAMLQGQSDRDVLVLLAKIYTEVGEAKAADKILQQLIDSEEDGLRLLELAEFFQQRELPRWRSAVAEKVWARWPRSYRAGILKVEALRQEGKIAEALEMSEALGESFPDITAIKTMKARINYQGGFYRQAIKHCEQILAYEPGRLDIQLLRVRGEMALGNTAEATRLVQELFPVEGAQFLKKLFADSVLPLPQSRHTRSLWQILTFKSEPFFDLVGEVLSARAFCDTIPERRTINELVTTVLVKLRWEKSIRSVLLGAGEIAHGEGKLAKMK